MASSSPKARVSLVALGAGLIGIMNLVRGPTVLGLDGDLLLHLAYGEAVWAEGGLPSDDPLVFTTRPDDAFVLGEWLSELIFVLLDHAMGLGGPLLLAAAVGSTVTGALAWRALARTGSLYTAAVVAVIAHLGLSTHFLVRPHLFSWAGFLAVLVLLERHDAGRLRTPSTSLALFGLSAVWTNLHPGVVIGLVPLAAHALGTLVRTRRLASVGPTLALTSAFAAGLVVNPWGLGLWTHLLGFAQAASEGLNPAGDFHAPNLGSGTLYKLLALAAVGLGLAIRGLRTWSWTDRLLLAATFLLGATSMRNLPFLGIALAWVVPEAVASLLWTDESFAARDRQIAAPQAHAAVFPTVTVLAILGLPLSMRPMEPAGANLPTETIAWMDAHPDIARELGFGGFNASAYLLHASPVERLHSHALNAITPPRLMGELHVLFSASPGWQEQVDAYDLRWAIVPEEAGLHRELTRDARWSAVLDDVHGTLFVRSEDDATSRDAQYAPDASTSPDPRSP